MKHALVLGLLGLGRVVSFATPGIHAGVQKSVGFARDASSSCSVPMGSSSFVTPVARPRASAHGTMSMALMESDVSAKTAAELIEKAQAIVDSDMGVKSPSLLAEDFRYTWNFNGDLSKSDYLSPAKGPNTGLRTALPDLIWNLHDVRVDKYDSNRVWGTLRMTGTHRGPLVWEGKEIAPTLTKVVGAPECVSFAFDPESGLCTRMTGGFCIDRGVGNTGPVGGLWGVLEAIGSPVPSWKFFPPAKVITDVLAPSFRPRQFDIPAAPPIREPLMIALAKQALVALKDDPEGLEGLLSKDFDFYSPYLSFFNRPKKLVAEALKLADFQNGLSTDYNVYDARIDPFDPSRVWLTTRSTVKVIGPIKAFGKEVKPTKKEFTAGPETLSVSFDKNGFVRRITAGCVMDPELSSETDGLSNFTGLLAGLGVPLPTLFTEPLPVTLRRTFGPKKAGPRAPKPKPKPEPKPSAAPAPKAKAGGAGAEAGAGVKAPAANAAPKTSAPKAVLKAAPKPTFAPPPKKPASPMPVPSKAPPKPTPPKAKPAPVKKAAVPTGGKIATVKTAPSPSPKKAPSPTPLFGGLFSKAPTTAPSASAGAAAPASPSKTAAKKAVKPEPVPPAPKPSNVPKAKPAPKTAKPLEVEFSPQLTKQLLQALGSESKLQAFSKRTNLYARGAISARDYWQTLNQSLGKEGIQNTGPDIIGALPPGNQKKALFAIFSTE